MDSQHPPLQTIQDIKRMMERSSRFISLSGWSGVAAGICALGGAYAAYLRLEREVAIARTNPKFWQHSDWLHNIYREREPIGWGVLDFGRYDR